MIEILNPFGVGQYQSSIAFCVFGRLADALGVFLTLFADRFAARAISTSFMSLRPYVAADEERRKEDATALLFTATVPRRRLE
jgi:hypothetical protein